VHRVSLVESTLDRAALLRRSHRPKLADIPLSFQYPQYQPYQAPPPGRSDAEHLKLLVVFHYVLAGFTALLSLFPIFHIAMGLAMLSGSGPFGSLGTHPPHGGPDPRWFGWTFVALGSFIILVGETAAVLTLLAGKSIAQRRRHTFCLVVAGLQCMNAPLGTALGVFTFVVLLRPSVKAEFMRPDPGNIPYAAPPT
jgi:hypothetical protein